MTPVRWGVLGAGQVAHTFGRAATANGVTIAAVGSTDADRGAAYARTFSIPTVHASYFELVTDPDVDAIYVATPHPWHAENALLALEHAKHVLIEKPMALNESQARAVLDRAEQLGLIVLDGLWTRYLPMHRRIRQIVAEGLIGDVVTVFADHSQALTDDAEHRINNPYLGGGALLDLGVYSVGFILDLLGEVRAVHATGSLKGTGVDGQATLVIQGSGNTTGIAHTASTGPGANTAFVLGTKGRIDITANFYSPSSFVAVNTARETIEEFVSPDPLTGFAHEMYEMQRLVDTGERISDCMTPQNTLAVMRVLDEARRQLGVVYPIERLKEAP